MEGILVAPMKMTKKSKLFGYTAIVLIIIAIIAATLYGILSYAFTQSFTSLYVEDISLTPEECSLKIDTWNSGIYFFGYKHFVEDRTLQITIYTGPYGKKWPVKINIADDALAEVERICFKNGQSMKQIYPQ